MNFASLQQIPDRKTIPPDAQELKQKISRQNEKIIKTRENTKEWTLPPQLVSSITESTTYMKQVIVIAVSTITHIKGIFPEESYEVETFGGVPLRTLKRKCDDESAQYFSTVLINSFEALEKKYLAKLELWLYEDSSEDSLAETYTLEFTYLSSGTVVDLHSSKYTLENIRHQTLELVKNCVRMAESSNDDGHDLYDAVIRLYYNSAAPAGYQAPGFAPPAEGARGAGGALPVGSTETPFHRLVVRAARRDLCPPSSCEPEPSLNSPVIPENDFSVSAEEQGSTWDTDRTEVAAPLRCECSPRSVPAASAALLITCHYCGTAQHGVCYGALGAAPARAPHCCARCAGRDRARRPTCPLLATLNPSQREKLCLSRHVLLWLAARRRVSRERLGAAAGGGLAAWLRRRRVLRPAPRRPDSHLEVDHKELKNALKEYFTSDEDTLERLMVEPPSQEETTDLSGDTLGSLAALDQTDLQKATTMGKIIQHKPQTSHVEDSTLKQYKEAIIPAHDADEELPLSGAHNPRARDHSASKRKAEDSNTGPRYRLRTKKSKDDFGDDLH